MTHTFHHAICLSVCLLGLISQAAWAQTAATQGLASYYNDGLHGRRTSSGERYDKRAFTCANLDYPFGSVLRVTRLDNNKSVDVRVNDCGPHRADRIVDLSRAAAVQIGLIRDGLAMVKVELIMPGDGKMPCRPSANKDTNVTTTTTPNTNVTTTTTTPASPTQSAVVVPQVYDAATGTEGPKVEPIPEHEPPVMPSEGTLPVSALKPLNSGFAVQVGSFVNYDNAVRLTEQLQAKGFQNVLIGNKGNVFRVMLGPFTLKEEAQRYGLALRRNHNMDNVIMDLSTD